MASWFRKWPWVFASAIVFILLIVVMPAIDRALLLFSAFQSCANYIDAIEIPVICARQRQIGFLVFLVVAAPLFLFLFSLAYPRGNAQKQIDERYPSKSPLQKEAYLPSGYGLCSGPIEAVPDSGMQLSISGEKFNAMTNGLFVRHLVVSGEQVYGVYRSIPFIGDLRLLLALYVPRTKQLLGIGNWVQLLSLIVMAFLIVWGASMAPDWARPVAIFAAVYLALDVTYLILVARAKGYLSRHLVHGGIGQ